MGRLSVLSVLLVAASLATVSCGDGRESGDDDARRDDPPAETDTTPSTSRPADTTGGGGDGCDAFQDIVDLDDEFQGELNGLLTPALDAMRAGRQAEAEEAFTAMMPEMQAMLAEDTPPLLDAYDRLSVARPELATDVQTVRDYTEGLVAALSDPERVGTLEDLVAVFEEEGLGEAAAAGAATLRLDEVSRADCDLVLAD